METKLGLGNGTIGKWGKNGRVPNYSNLDAVCSELGVSVEDIMRDDDVVPTSNKNAENAKKAPAAEGEGYTELQKAAIQFVLSLPPEKLAMFLKMGRAAFEEDQ